MSRFLFVLYSYDFLNVRKVHDERQLWINTVGFVFKV